jgi:hypothetical protein
MSHSPVDPVQFFIWWVVITVLGFAGAGLGLMLASWAAGAS